MVTDGRVDRDDPIWIVSLLKKYDFYINYMESAPISEKIPFNYGNLLIKIFDKVYKLTLIRSQRSIMWRVNEKNTVKINDKLGHKKRVFSREQ